MITPELKYKAEKLYTMVLNADEIINKQAKEIYQLPQEERKQYFDEHYPVKDYIDESWQLIAELLKELDKRPTKQQYEQTKQMLTEARNYIKALGGNPHLLPHA